MAVLTEWFLPRTVYRITVGAVFSMLAGIWMLLRGNLRKGAAE